MQSVCVCVCLHTPRYTSAFAPLPGAKQRLGKHVFFLEIIDNESLRVQGFLSARNGGGRVRRDFISSIFYLKVIFHLFCFGSTLLIKVIVSPKLPS